MKILCELLPDEIDTDDFYWNRYSSEENVSNFWVYESEFQVQWYNGDPGRGTFCSEEIFNAEDAIKLVFWVLESYDIFRDGK